MNTSNPERIINWWLDWNDLNWPGTDIKEKIKERAYKADMHPKSDTYPLYWTTTVKGVFM